MKRSTPYDDVHRTLVTDCRHLMLPLVNEVFGEKYTGSEEVFLRMLDRGYSEEEAKEISGIDEETWITLQSQD